MTRTPRPATWSLQALVGAAVLIFTAALVLVMPPNAVVVISATVATVLLAADRRLGPLPAAVLVALVLPWGRGADTLTYELAGIPLRPHDAVLAVGFLGTLPVLWARRPVLTPTLVLAAGLLVLGAGALLTGVVLGNEPRDIVRDLRWWSYYGVIVLALFGGTTRPALLRGVLIGMTLFAILVVVAALLPAFPGGLKGQELTYDRGTLRMQFGNSAFLVFAAAYTATRLLRRPAWLTGSWLLLLSVAVVLSLTRTSIIVTATVVGLCLVLHLFKVRRRLSWPGGLARPAGELAIVAALALVVGLAVNIAGTPAGTQPATSGDNGSDPIDRLLFRGSGSDLDAIETGRFPTYRAAAAIILDYPITGAGMGSLTDVDYAYSAARAHTLRRLPSVDNAYLTVGLKAGIPGIVVLAALVLATFLAALRRGGSVATWLLPSWIGIVVLSMTQAFAVSFYGPFPLALLIAYPVLQRGFSGPRRRAAAGAPPTGT